jgi:hypothetical protein
MVAPTVGYPSCLDFLLTRASSTTMITLQKMVTFNMGKASGAFAHRSTETAIQEQTNAQ